MTGAAQDTHDLIYDFHTHTFVSDGELSPLELAYRCEIGGYAVVAITDHAGIENLEITLSALSGECERASEAWGIQVLNGVELTYVPPALIDLAALRAKELGARIVIVHGETVSEIVPPGTNRAAVESPAVDVLAHPGLLDAETAEIARDSGKFIELSARRAHATTNGLVAAICSRIGAPMIVNSDAHRPEDLLTERLARITALGAGLSPQEVERVLEQNPHRLLERIGAGAVLPSSRSTL